MKSTQSINISIRKNITVALGLLSTLLPFSQNAHAQADLADAFVAPAVFQAAGPTAASIQSTVDAYRAALGNVNNGNNPGPLASGRREINWDGGNPAIMDTTPPVNPFNVFLNTRGTRFTTPGMGLSQAAPVGLETLFANPNYGEIFKAFSPSRLFTPVGSNVTDGFFFVPGTGFMLILKSGFPFNQTNFRFHPAATSNFYCLRVAFCSQQLCSEYGSLLSLQFILKSGLNSCPSTPL